jgi:hypothetical protein
MPSEELRTFRQKLREFSASIPEDVGDVAEMPPKRLQKLREELGEVVDALRDLVVRLDPVEHPSALFDPGSPSVGARVIAEALLTQPRVPLGAVRPFWGAGVYALYYTGDHRAYERISRTEIPIYVGKADPKVGHAETAREQGQALYIRLADHADSIRAAEEDEEATLSLADFQCRYLPLDSAWQSVSETYLIRHFRPIWNKESKVCQGLGKHGDATSTRDNRKSKWDTLHPGRAWARDAQPNALSRKELIARIRAYADETYKDL